MPSEHERTVVFLPWSHRIGLTYHHAQLLPHLQAALLARGIDLWAVTPRAEQEPGLLEATSAQLGPRLLLFDDSQGLGRAAGQLPQSTLVHAHGLRQLQLWSRLKRRDQVLFSVHSYRNLSWRKSLARLLTKVLSRRASAIVQFSPFCVSDYGQAHRTVLIPDGSELVPSDPPSPPNDGVLRLLYLANLTRGKGHDWGIEAVALARSMGVRVVARLLGDGPLRDRLRATIQRHGLCQSIELVGRVPRDEVEDHIRWSSAALVLSRNETFGACTIEPMSAGRCVIGTAVGIGHSLLYDYLTGLRVPYGNRNRLASCIAYAYTHPCELMRMGSNAAAMSNSVFRWPMIAEAYAAAYERHLACKSH